MAKGSQGTFISHSSPKLGLATSGTVRNITNRKFKNRNLNKQEQNPNYIILKQYKDRPGTVFVFVLFFIIKLWFWSLFIFIFSFFCLLCYSSPVILDELKRDNCSVLWKHDRILHICIANRKEILDYPSIVIFIWTNNGNMRTLWSYWHNYHAFDLLCFWS